MLQTYDAASLDAFAQLLAQPDPADLPRRSHVRRFEGDPDRRATRLPAILMNWLQRRHLENEIDEPIVSSTRTRTGRGRVNPGLRVLRPTGTC